MTEDELKELKLAIVEKVKETRVGGGVVDEGATEKYEELWQTLEVFESLKTRTGANITRGLMNCPTYGGRALALQAPATTVRHVGFIANAHTAVQGGKGKSDLFRPIPTAFAAIYWAPLNSQYCVCKVANNNQIQANQQYDCLVDAIERLAEIVGET